MANKELRPPTKCPSFMGRLFGHKFEWYFSGIIHKNCSPGMFKCTCGIGICERCGYKIVED